MQKAHKIIIDIGNSRSKYFFVDNGNDFSFSSLEELLCFLEEQVIEGIFDIFIVSTISSYVNSEKDLNQAEFIKKLKETFAEKTLNLRDIEIFDAKKQNFMSGTYDDLGADRVAKLTAALKKFPDKNIILMDFGTATTVSVANYARDYLGGFIGLGMRSSLKALSEYCDALADHSRDEELGVLIDNYEEEALRQVEDFKSSKQAILRGTVSAHIGLVNQWLFNAKKLLDKFDDKPSISICTGGEAGYFARYFDYHIEEVDLLKLLPGAHNDVNFPAEQNLK